MRQVDIAPAVAPRRLVAQAVDDLDGAVRRLKPHRLQEKIPLVSVAAAARTHLKMDAILKSLSRFKAPKRRMEVIANFDAVTVYDDFAHHPTAFETTLAAIGLQLPRATAR